MSRSIIFENQEQMQCVNFGFDDFFPSARNELDTCSLNQKLMFVKKKSIQIVPQKQSNEFDLFKILPIFGT